MRITIAAVGKMKSGAPSALVSDYLSRLPWKVQVKEIAARGRSEEASLLLEATAACDKRVALDERGKALSSKAFAETLKAWQLDGDSHIGFIIGGAEGLSDEVRQRANLTLSFGQATWPHMLTRAMLSEQLYRAYTLMTGHPYHRE